jgi:DNA-binding CsgD family transcriptional regulator
MDTRAVSRDLLLAVLDEVDHGMLLVNEDAEVRWANRSAVRDCGSAQPLHYDGRRVRAANAHDRDELTHALAGARRGRRSMLTVHGEHQSVCVGVVPLDGSLDDGDSVALLVLGKRAECDPLNLQFFAQMHRLTPAESAVLSGLCAGLRPSQVAARGGVALSTVRSQIDSIRQKTRARGVHDVVRMVQMMPPVVSLVHGVVRQASPPRRGGDAARALREIGLEIAARPGETHGERA